jgi:hypothetical protein
MEIKMEKQFSMSMFASTEALHKARADHYHQARIEEQAKSLKYCKEITRLRREMIDKEAMRESYNREAG